MVYLCNLLKKTCTKRTAMQIKPKYTTSRQDIE